MLITIALYIVYTNNAKRILTWFFFLDIKMRLMWNKKCEVINVFKYNNMIMYIVLI